MKWQIPRWVWGLAVLALLVGSLLWVIDRRGQERRLFDAATAGDVATVRALLGRGISPNARERRDTIETSRYSEPHFCTRWRTPLHAAASSGGDEVVRLLIEAGADVNATAADGHTALMLAAKWREVGVVQRLLAAGARPNHREWILGNTAPQIAAARGDVAILRALVEARADVDTTNEDGATPLCQAAKYGHLEAAKLLLKHGAAVRFDNAQSPFYAAAHNGHLEVARLLLAHGADPREPFHKTTPLQAATDSKHWRVARFVREATAKYDARRENAPLRRAPAPWKDERVAVRHWDDTAEFLALVVVLPLVATCIVLCLLVILWREDGLERLKRVEGWLPLRGRWLRMLLTVVLVLLEIPLSLYSFGLLFWGCLWLLFTLPGVVR